MKVVVTIGASHIKRIDRLNRRQIRKMGSAPVRKACRKMRAQGILPLCAVDDLSMHSAGPWIDNFAYGLTSAAKREGVSIVGGEMAQMRDTYAPGYVGVVVYVTGLNVRYYVACATTANLRPATPKRISHAARSSPISLGRR